MKKPIIVLVLAAACAFSAWGGDALSLADLSAAAVKGNLDLKKAQSALETAREALQGTLTIENSKLSVSGSYGSGQNAESGSLSGKADLTVPIIPQLSVGASASSEGRASASLAFSPFASGTATYKQNETYAKAALALSSAAARLEYDVQAAAFSVISARKALAAAQAKAALEEEKRTVAEKAYDLDQITYDELGTRRAAAVSARQGAFDAEKSLLNAQVALYKLLGPESGEPEVKDVSVYELSALTATRADALSKLQDGNARSSNLAALQIELESLKAQLDATPAYAPSLSLSAHVDYPLSYGAGISFSFSPSDIKVDERKDIEESIVEKNGEITLERMSMRFQLSVLRQSLSSAQTVLETRQADLAQAETNRNESAALLKQGHVTSLEDRQSELDLADARAGLFSSMAQVLKAQADLALMWQ